MGLSFPTISSTGANGGEILTACLPVYLNSVAAIIHYQPDPKDCATIDKNEVRTALLFHDIKN